jgi:hypothetical protein
MEHTPLGVILIVAASLVAVALFNEHKQTEAHYQAARKEYEASKWVIPQDLAARRVHADYKSYREEWREEQDLDAQQQMARTSWWQMWATWIGVGLLVLTLIETNRTAVAAGEAINEAREANKISRDIGEAQVRAYVAIGKISLPEEPNNRKVLSVRVAIHNAGLSPARNVYGEHCVAVALSDGESALLPRPEPMRRPSKLTLQAGDTNYVVVNTQSSEIPFSDVYVALSEGKCEFYVWGWIKYEDVFGIERETTYQWFLNKASLESGVGFRADELGNEAT